MDRELQRVIEMFIRIALRGIGRQKEQFDLILMPVQPGCGLFPAMYLSRSRHFPPSLAGRWRDIPPATFRCEKDPVSGRVSSGAGKSIPSAAYDPAHSRLIFFSDTFSRRMRTLSSASTDCRGSQIPLDGVL